MARIIWHVTMSLDGFIAPPDDSADWMFGHGAAGPLGGETVRRTGAILSGRRGYDLGNRPGEGPRRTYGGAWSGPVFVLTHRPAAPVDGITFLSGDIGEAVTRARAAAGDRDVGVFGADVARQCLRAGLLDELIVHLVPVLLGGGVRLFDSPDLGPVTLRKTRCDDSGQITDLVCEVAR
ncbi:dihydrofolate reductase family protein [Micromonospora sp. MS34]|uniref:dihydrofolate reductase family protein n=1 Tax=Micromonospora sp. MS34 TaxID=3385971 RepID=UPI0039A3D254